MINYGIIDVRAVINGKNNVDIEMQVADKTNIIERILLYWSRMYEKQIKKGQDYIVLNRCISVIFLEHSIPKLSELPIHTKWQIKESENGKILLTDRLEIHIIELRKKVKSKEDEAIQKWLAFFENPYGKEIKEMSEEKEEIKVALEALEEINADEEKVRIAELREKYILDRNTEIRNAKEVGKQEGIKIGEQKGMDLGKQNEKVEIARKMKEKNMDVQTIMELTGLTEEEINKLK